MNDRITEILRKVHALAEHGVAGEREAARVKLESLMAKHGLTLEQVISPERAWYWFYCPKDAESILVNVTCEVVNSPKIKVRRHKHEMAVCLTPAEHADVKDMWTHYFRIYNKERLALRKRMKLLASAINAQFGIGSKVESDDEPSTLSEADIFALMQMMRSVQGTKWQKPKAQIEAGQ